MKGCNNSLFSSQNATTQPNQPYKKKVHFCSEYIIEQCLASKDVKQMYFIRCGKEMERIQAPEAIFNPLSPLGKSGKDSRASANGVKCKPGGL